MHAGKTYQLETQLHWKLIQSKFVQSENLESCPSLPSLVTKDLANLKFVFKMTYVKLYVLLAPERKTLLLFLYN